MVAGGVELVDQPGLSARFSDALDVAQTHLFFLRDALIAVAGFDRATEPVPFLPRDDRLALLALARHLALLAERAARSTGRPRGELVHAALDLVERRHHPDAPAFRLAGASSRH